MPARSTIVVQAPTETVRICTRVATATRTASYMSPVEAHRLRPPTGTGSGSATAAGAVTD